MIGGMLHDQGIREFIFNNTTMEYNSSFVAYFDYVDCAHFFTFEARRMDEADGEEEKNIEEFEVSDAEFGFDDEGLQDENIGIGIRVQRQMDSFGYDGVRVNPELGSDSDKSNELNSDHDSNSDGLRYSDFNAETDMINPKLVKGLIFSDRNVWKEAIKHYDRMNRFQVRLQKNDG
ncbi:hypothetical protein V6N12_034300 [Hibiscus sabdariffa]|uniref:Uncharacterized protein n=1 Tax=Hibiscus sabdariffa TaxID=183260 RepID=A0ABR1ZSC1_9ROSI